MKTENFIIQLVRLSVIIVKLKSVAFAVIMTWVLLFLINIVYFYFIAFFLYLAKNLILTSFLNFSSSSFLLLSFFDSLQTLSLAFLVLSKVLCNLFCFSLPFLM